MPTKSTHVGRISVLIVAALALAIATLTGMASPADAAWSDCPAGNNCWWLYENGQGQRWQVAGDNRNLQRFGINPRSGYNNGTSGMTTCGYAYTDYVGLTYGRPWQDTENFTHRIIQSNRWVWGNCN